MATGYVSSSDSNAAPLAVRWLRDNSDQFPRRALVADRKNMFEATGALATYTANKNVGSLRGTWATPGGPVLALHASLKLLTRAITLAGEQPLAVIEHAPGEVAGWAAATQAINLETGHPTEDVEPGIRDELVALSDAGYKGYHYRDEYFKAKSQPPINALIEAGYDYPFVASYLVALGKDGDQVGDLRKIYKRT